MTLGLTLGFLFTLGWVPIYRCRAEAVSAALQHYNRTERPWVLLSVTIMSLHVTISCAMVSFARAIPPWRATLGIVLFAAGIAFWFWGRVRIAPLHERRLPEQPPLQLRRDGAFGIVRHPLYASMLIAAGAPVLVAPSAYLLLSFACCVVILAVRAVQEERRLQAQLGAAYEAYCGEVRRLIPFVW